MKIIDKRIFFDDLSAEYLVNKFGTPLYIMEEKKIKESITLLKKFINYPYTEIHYSCKANSNIWIMKIIRSYGILVDTASLGEVYLASKAGFSNTEILFSGNNVSDEEMIHLIRKRIFIIVDSISQLKRFGQLNQNAKVGIRINPRIGSGHHSYCITGGINSRFGIDPAKINEINYIAQQYNLHISGIHMHIGSGILKVTPFLNAFEILLNVAGHFENIDFVDIGGGIGIPYSEEEETFNIKEFGDMISTRFAQWISEYGKKVTLKLEPGRFLVAEAGTLLTRVNTIKNINGRIFVGTDTNTAHLIRPLLYGSYHKILVDGKVNNPKFRVTICGNLCEACDILANDRLLCNIREGDILAILKTGAYGFAMSSNYNSKLRPAEILVNGIRAKTIRERETLKDLLRGQHC